MKTFIRSVLCFTFAVAGFSGCGSSSNNTSSTAAAAVTTAYNSAYFSYNGSTCTNLQTGASVNTAYCTSNPFSSNGSGCYDSVSGTYVATQYCATTSVSGTTAYGYTAQVCYGMYYVYSGSNAQLVQCNGSNCRGYILYSVATKTPVVCQ